MTYAGLIQPVLWLIAGGTAAFFGGKAVLAYKRKKPVKNNLIAAVVALFAVVIIVPAIAVVPAGQRGVIYAWNGGVQKKARGEGVSFVVPWLQHVTTVSVRTQKVFSSKVYAQSSDLQEITVVASVNYHIDPARAAHLYQAVGPQYPNTIIQPALFQRTKAAVGQIEAESFALNRAKLVNTIKKQLTDQLAGYGIVVEYVNIEDAIFDPAFVKAVKDKIIAQQQAKQQHNLIDARRAQKTQTIINAQAAAQATLIKATAQARANKKIAATITPLVLQSLYLQKWDGTLPTTLVGSGKDPSLFLNIQGQ